LLFRFLALVFFATAASVQSQTATPPPGPTPSLVYVARDRAAISRYRTNAALVRRMVDRLVTAATATDDVASAWRSLVSPDDKVGIKICAAGGELFTTHSDLVRAIADGLVAAGVRRENIVVWDRQLVGINEAGYRNFAYRLAAIEPRDGYDGTATVTPPLLGKLIWGDLRYVPHIGANPIAPEMENSSTESHFAKILTQQVTKVINVPVMSDSSTVGLAGCIYNMTLPNIDNWRRFAQGDYASGVGLAQVYADPAIAKKVVLHIMDGLIATYAGGPEAHPNFAVHDATLLASKDPVAIDVLALTRLEELRARARLPAIAEVAAHVRAGAEMGLGQGARNRIVVKEVGP
jgi:hypothetical protein